MNSSQPATIQEREQNVEEKKIKCVAFCLEQNQIFSISKSQNEYLTKKQKRKLARRVTRALRGKGTEDTTSSEDEEPIVDDHSYSIVEWKKMHEIQRAEKPHQQIKSVLKKTCHQSIQKDLIAAYEEILKEEQEQMKTQLVKKVEINNFTVSKFDDEVTNHINQISITIDELEDFGFYHCPRKYDISDFDEIKKKIDQDHDIINYIL